MTKKWKNIKVGGKSIKAPDKVYYLIKQSAKKQDLSMSAYLERLVREDETIIVQKQVTEHLGVISNLMTQYVDSSFSDIISYVQVIFLRAAKLDIESRKTFLAGFEKRLEEVVRSMETYKNKRGVDEI